MAVLIEANSVIIRCDSILEKFHGGWPDFEAIIPNNTLCMDSEIARVGFMYPHDLDTFVENLEHHGLEFLRDDKVVDIAIASQVQGLTRDCSWLEFGHVDLIGNGQRVAACRFVGSQITDLVTPPGWEYAQSLSASYGYIPPGQSGTGLTFLRRQNGVDVYWNELAGKEVYIGRIDEKYI